MHVFPLSAAPLPRWILPSSILPLLSLLCCIALAADSPAPEMNVDSHSRSEVKKMSLEQLFQQPPAEYRMLQIIHPFPDDPEGNPYREFVAPYREKHPDHSPSAWLADFLKDYGYGGVVANVSFADYLLSEKAWEVFLQGLRDCRERGLLVWLYDEKGYPSGKAGGLTLQQHPEFECLGLLCSRSEGQGAIHHSFPQGERYVGDPLRVAAAPLKDGKPDLSRSIDLPDSTWRGAAEVTWQAPDSNAWVVMSFHVKRMYEGTHIVTNLSDPLPYIDIMNRDAVARFIELTHQAYYNRCGKDLWSCIDAIFTDEPSLMVGYLRDDPGLLPALPWSQDFEKAFASMNGYDLSSKLPGLYFEGGEESAYARLDFWRLVSKLVEENYYGQIQDWCQEHGIASSGHTLLEEGLYYHVLFEGNLYQNLRRMDIPGIDILSSDPEELAHSNQLPVPKFVSSVTHALGKKKCQSETSSHVQRTGNKPCSFEQRLGTINWMFTLGLNTVTSYYWPGEFSDSERRLFNDHIGRLAALLSEGQHVADRAVYYPVHSMWASITPTAATAWQPPLGERARKVDRNFSLASQDLLARQLDYDFVDDQAILEAEIKEGMLALHGEAFSCLVLPEAWVIPLAVFEKVQRFVEAGGALVVIGNLPELADQSKDTIRVREITQNLRQSPRVAICPEVNTMSDTVAKMSQVDLLLDSPCREMFYHHCRYQGKDIYFISNNGPAEVQRNVTFSCSGKVEKWHPSTGMIEPLTASGDEKATLQLDFKPFEGYFVVFSKG